MTSINSVVAFIIGLAIILLASILNAAGLNLTKLDHLLGSTLALEYMRAEYVAPLGASSLIFNFLFARFLVGTPVTANDIYASVIGIVAFGSINSGLSSQTDVTHLTYLWRRGGWLGFFFLMSAALAALLIFAERLDGVLVARSDLHSVPATQTDIPLALRPDPLLPNSNSRIRNPDDSTSRDTRVLSLLRSVRHAVRFLRAAWATFLIRVTAWLEAWTAPQEDKQVAWTLGIAWACCGGGLAGGTLVFAKATVKLLSGSLSKQNPGNQFGHAAPIFTILLLAVTAVLQIICLNRGLKVYDSTLVVPVFYGVYTATGFLDSLIFNDEVDAYQGWTLFLIFVSILILISGVVLLTHKKPELTSSTTPSMPSRPPPGKGRKHSDAEQGEVASGEQQVLWTVGEDDENQDGSQAKHPAHLEDEDPDLDHHQNPEHAVRERRDVKGKNVERPPKSKGKGKSVSWKVNSKDEEGVGLIGEEEDEEDEDVREHSQQPHGSSSTNRHSTNERAGRRKDDDDDDDDFGEWEGVTVPRR
ncbi:hypothetical protein H0H93_003413 [Arthromyces matolae]|nr:hypothetical protein H0H93_003413 [Arthromyces matolae]